MPNPYLHNCSGCPTPCDGHSLGNYQFMNDVEFSEAQEQSLIADIRALGFWAQKTTRYQYADVEVYDREGGRHLLNIEVKAQRRTFMQAQQKFGLAPSETVALNLSDLEHYVEFWRQDNIPTYIAWSLMNRPCILGERSQQWFYAPLRDLAQIRQAHPERIFRRRSGQGDVDENGRHRGVVVNYHFSLNELYPLHLQPLLEHFRKKK